MPGKLIINADSSKAQKAVNMLSGSYTEMNQAVNLATRGLSMLTNVLGGLDGTLKESADWWSMVGKNSLVTLDQMKGLMKVSDGMIKSSTILKSMNILQRANIKTSTSDMENLVKASVTLGRSLGKSSESVMELLTKSLAGGKIAALNNFGLSLEMGGTVAEKQAKVIQMLRKEYGGLTIAASDYAEKEAKLSNEMKARKMEGLKGISELAQKYTQFKGAVLEGSMMVIDAVSGSSMSLIGSSKKQFGDGMEAIQGYQAAIQKGTQERIHLQKQEQIALEELNRAKGSGANLEKERQLLEKYTKAHAELTQNLDAEATAYKNMEKITDILSKNQFVNQEFRDKFIEDSFKIGNRLQATNRLREEQARLINNVNTSMRKQEDLVRSLGFENLAQVTQMVNNAFSLLDKKIDKNTNNKKKNKKATVDLMKVQKERLQVLFALSEKFSSINQLIPKNIEDEKRRLLIYVAASTQERKRIDLLKQATTEFEKLYNIQKKGNEARVRAAQQEKNRMFEQKNAANELLMVRIKELQFLKRGTGKNLSEENAFELIQKKQLLHLTISQRSEYLKNHALRQQINTANKEAAQAEVEAAKAKLLYLSAGSSGVMGEMLKRAELQLQQARLDKEKQGITLAEKRIVLLQREANSLGKLRSNYSGLFQAGSEAQGMMQTVSRTGISAMLEENKALKTAGDTRAAMVKRATAAVLKAKAIEWGVEALGELALGTATSFTNPAESGSHFTAAAIYGVASLAAGAATKQMQSAGWTKKPTSGGSSSAGQGAGSQAPTATTEQVGSSVSIYITESVIGGSMDAVAGQIKTMIDSGQTRGTIEAWS